MTVQAKQWVNYNGKWHMGGARFDIADGEYAEMSAYVDAVDEPAPVAAPEEKTKRRRRKTDE